MKVGRSLFGGGLWANFGFAPSPRPRERGLGAWVKNPNAPVAYEAVRCNAYSIAQMLKGRMYKLARKLPLMS